ncbi:transposase, partial [Streptomyces sp. SID2888]|uniref:transposase n=1 Tax=Streptomyces sp. SID2888 TaxID=2690256 RepID=UPI001EFF741F
MKPPPQGDSEGPDTFISRTALLRAAFLQSAPLRIQDTRNEITAFQPLLDSLDLTGTVITADALHTQHAHGTYLRSRGAHYTAQVKANHPGLFDRVRHLPWREITLDHHDRTRAHHRLEIRRL